MNKQWYHMGIDGGGSHCRARLYAPDGSLIGTAKSGPANSRLDPSLVENSIQDVTNKVLVNANLDQEILQDTKVGLGLAGIISETDILRFSHYCKLFPNANLQSDSYIACLGAHNGDDGAILVTGTGTSVMLIQDGVPNTICSWGFRVADQASGARMGLLAIRASLKAHDKIIPQSDLSRALMKDFNDSPCELVNWSENATPSDYAKYAPQIVLAATAEDPIARLVTEQCFADFLELLDMLITRGANKISLIGGLAEIYKQWIPQTYHSILREPLGDPIDGAIIMAKKMETEN